MSQIDAASGGGEEQADEARGGSGGPAVRTVAGRGEGGFLRKYKPEQGKWTRGGTFVGAGAVIAWGGSFAHEQLRGLAEGEEAWRQLISPGIPILLMVAFGVLVYWVAYVNRKSCDFMIATEGEMKKVNWSSRREVIGSTKVVIVLTMFLALLLFGVDLLFQAFFQAINVLKATGG